MVINWFKPFRILIFNFILLNLLISRHIIADLIIAVLLIVFAVKTLRKIKYIRQLSFRLFNNANSLIVLNDSYNDINILKRFLVINPSGIAFNTEVVKEENLFNRIFKKEFKQSSYSSDQISAIAVQNEEIIIYLHNNDILFFKNINLSEKALKLLSTMNYIMWHNGEQMQPMVKTNFV